MIVTTIIYFAFLFLVYQIVFIFPYTLYKIRKKRLEIAETMNAEFIQPGGFQSSHQVPSADMEIQYMPSSSNAIQSQVIPRGQVLQVPTVIHDQPLPAQLNEQERPKFEQNMDGDVPSDVSIQSNSNL